MSDDDHDDLADMTPAHRALWERHYALEAAGMETAAARHRRLFEAGEVGPDGGLWCGKGWCEMCFWHPSSSWFGPGYRPVWLKAPPHPPAPSAQGDLFAWAGA